MRTLRSVAIGSLGFAACVVVALCALGQTVDPTSISIGSASPVCTGGNSTVPACITLPPGATIDKVDVFFLFDDTGSFAGFVPTVASIFAALVTDLETALPGVELGFGVGRFEDYGGPGNGFSGESTSGRPFILNQPIVTAATAGGAAARDALIAAALARTAPGFGGDGPESSIAEGLFQVANGTGFDGNGDASTTGVGGAQVAGALPTQTSPDASGDVPAFSTLAPGVPASGSVGGAGFRSGTLRLAILATDICSVAAFDPATGIPTTLTGAGVTVPVADVACSSTVPGSNRFGFVSNSKTSAGNTVSGAVAPAGAGTVPATIAALNARGIRVLGMGPSASPQPVGSGPSFSPSVLLSTLARLTGAVDEMGTPLVFDIGAGGTPLKNAIVAAITSAATLPIDITLAPSGTVPLGLSVNITPSVVPNVGPGQQACFNAMFTGATLPLPGTFGLEFQDADAGTPLGNIPVNVLCEFDPFGGIVRTPRRDIHLTIRRPSPDTEGVRCAETDPHSPDFDSIPFTPFPDGEVDIDLTLSPGDGTKHVCCEYISTSDAISAPVCDSIVLATGASQGPTTAPALSYPMLALTLLLLLVIAERRLWKKRRE